MSLTIRPKASAIERIEGEVVLLPARTDRRPGRELLRFLVRPDHDGPTDRHLLQRDPGARECCLLRRALVGTSEPARAGESRPLGHARKRLALALRPPVACAYDGCR